MLSGQQGVRCTAVVASVTLALLLLASSSVGASAFGHARRLPTPSGSPKTAEVQVSAVSCTSRGNCTASGQYTASRSSYVESPVVDTEDSGAWTSTKLALPADAVGHPASLGVSCPLAKDCLAVRSYRRAWFGAVRLGGVSWTLDRWIGTSTAFKCFDFRCHLDGLSVACTSVNECVVVGSYSTGQVAIKHSLTRSQRVLGDIGSAHAVGRRSTGGNWLSAIACTSLGNSRRWVVTGTASHSSNRSHRPKAMGNRLGRSAFQRRPMRRAAWPGSLAGSVSCPLADACFAGGSCDTFRGPELFLSPSPTTSGGAVRSFPSKYCRGPITSAAVQAISCSGVNRCTAVRYFVSTLDRRDATALTFFSNGRLVGQGKLRLLSGAAKISDQESAVSGVSCISPATCLAVGNFLDAYSARLFRSRP